MLAATENSSDLVAFRELIESGQVTPLVDRAYLLSQTPAAISYVHDGHARGKVIITV
jgi:NADPH:quinone reductase-like Zn-dependent oxidoreductase